jgi:hypothetical protein
MFIPKVNTPSFFQLNSNDPCKAQINFHVADNVFNVTIFKKDGSVYDTRDLNLDGGNYQFFDASLDSKYYYQIMCLENNSYDALQEHHLDIFMDIDKAMDLCETYNETNPQKYHSPDFTVCVKKIS